MIKDVAEVILHSITALIGLACLIVGFLLCLFSSWSARENWRVEMTFWVLGAAFVQALGLGLVIGAVW